MEAESILEEPLLPRLTFLPSVAKMSGQAYFAEDQ